MKLEKTLQLAAAVLLALPAAAQTAGDLAFIGWTDNTTPDQFVLATLNTIPSGTAVYFTDNGWDDVAGVYRGASTSNIDGNENVCKLTFVNAVAAGQIITAYVDTADWTWDTTSVINPAFPAILHAQLALAQAGDQIYALIASDPTNPLLSVTQNLCAIDDTGTYETATSSNSGNVPPGLTLGVDAITFLKNVTGEHFMGFNTSSLACGTKAQWQAAIATESNWTFGASGTLPSGTIQVGCSGCATPTTYCTALISSNGCTPAMSFSGQPSLANPGAFTVTGNNLEQTQNGLMFFGTTGPDSSPFFGGTLCVSAPLYRLNVANTGGAGTCAGALSYTLADMIAHPSGGSLVVLNAVVNAQIWTRDPPSAGTVNLTDGIQFSVCP
jgi:hypothetical protein